MELSETFYALLLTTAGGFVLTIDFCCIKIVRDIGAEVKEDIENKEETTEKKSND